MSVGNFSGGSVKVGIIGGTPMAIAACEACSKTFGGHEARQVVTQNNLPQQQNSGMFLS